MRHSNQRPSNRPAPTSREWWKLLFAVGATVAIVYFGHMRPADRNLLLLQRQCHELKVAVNQLSRHAATADRTLGVIDMLTAHNRQLSAAEDRLATISRRWDLLSKQAKSIANRTAPLGQLALVDSSLATHGQVLNSVLDAVDDLEIVHDEVAASPAKIAQARASLSSLDRLHSRLAKGLSRVEQASPALDRMDQLCGNVTEAHKSLAAASQTLAQAAGENVDQLNALALRVDAATDDAVASRKQLAGLVSLKDRLIASSSNTTEAEAMLARLNDLQASVLLADRTLTNIQHMVVDVMLIEPAAERAVTALKPVVEFTRLSRRLETKPVAETAEAPSSDRHADENVSASVAKEHLDIAKTILNWF